MNAQTKIAEPGTVYHKIATVTGILAREGIGKNRTATGAGANFNFRGIDDVYKALAPLLAEHRLCDRLWASSQSRITIAWRKK